MLVTQSGRPSSFRSADKQTNYDNGSMLTRLRKDLTEANYGLLGLEVILVIVGILIAFQIDRWAEEQREREQGHQYILRLKKDLQFEINIMTQSIEFADQRIVAVRLLEKITANPEIAKGNPNVVVRALEQVTWGSYPHVAAYVYTELQATGNLSLIRSDTLRHDLAEYYSFYGHYSGIGLDLELQNLFTRLTAGILSTVELVDIQENETDHWEIEISPDRAFDIAIEFSQRQRAVDLLPSLAQHHVFNKKFVKINRSRAERIVDMLDALIEEFET